MNNITMDTLREDAQGEMTLLRQFAHLEIKVAASEASYEERLSFFAFEDIFRGDHSEEASQVRSLYFALYDNILEAAGHIFFF